ncbi:MAG: RNA 2',3'-cyclic phosphodiesterase [Alphaproteobacteria bacterium]
MARLFVALDLPPSLSSRLSLLGGGVPGARWVEAPAMHITLAFLGEVGPHQEADVIAALAPIRFEPFDVGLAGFGAFGAGHRRRTIHMEVERSKPLLTLQHRIAHALERLGFHPEHSRYMPHITLARLKRADTERVARFLSEGLPMGLPRLGINGFTLFESHLAHTGAQYEERQVFGFDNVALAADELVESA